MVSATIELVEAMQPNQPPTIGGLTVSPEPVTAGDVLTVEVTGVDDPDGAVAVVSFFRDGDLIGTDADGSDGYALSVDTTGLAAGVYDYSAVATDDLGLASDARFAMSTVISPPPPPPPPPSGDDLAFTFLDAGADVRLFQIVDGATYQRGELPTNLSVEADNVDAEAESVAWTLEGPDGLFYENTENISFTRCSATSSRPTRAASTCSAPRCRPATTR